MPWRPLIALLALCGWTLAGCDSTADDDTADDDTADDDTATDDDTGDDDSVSEPTCEGIAPPGYGGANGFSVILDDGTQVTADDGVYRHEISATSSGLFIDMDNGSPPGTPVNGQDWYLVAISASPYTTMTAGEQDLQTDHSNGARLVMTGVVNYPEGAGSPRIYAVNDLFPDTGGTITCDQAPATGQPLHCAFDAVLIWSEHDPDTGDLEVAGCAGISGALDVTMDQGI